MLKFMKLFEKQKNTESDKPTKPLNLTDLNESSESTIESIPGELPKKTRGKGRVDKFKGVLYDDWLEQQLAELRHKNNEIDP